MPRSSLGRLLTVLLLAIHVCIGVLWLPTPTLAASVSATMASEAVANKQVKDERSWWERAWDWLWNIVIIGIIFVGICYCWDKIVEWLAWCCTKIVEYGKRIYVFCRELLNELSNGSPKQPGTNSPSPVAPVPNKTVVSADEKVTATSADKKPQKKDFMPARDMLVHRVENVKADGQLVAVYESNGLGDNVLHLGKCVYWKDIPFEENQTYTTTPFDYAHDTVLISENKLKGFLENVLFPEKVEEIKVEKIGSVAGFALSCEDWDTVVEKVKTARQWQWSEPKMNAVVDEIAQKGLLDYLEKRGNEAERSLVFERRRTGHPGRKSADPLRCGRRTVLPGLSRGNVRGE